MTPEEFKAKVQELVDGYRECGDYEHTHCAYDSLLEEALNSLGYSEGVKLMSESGCPMYCA